MAADSQTRSLARRLASLEKWRLQSKQPNLGYSTIEDGAIQATDADGVVRSVIGLQEDGTYTQIDKNGPPPPVPTEPTLSVQPGILVISSYGLTVSGKPWPLDFRRIDVHVSTTPDFVTTIATRVTEFSTDGGMIALALDEGTYYVKLVAVSTSGTKSDPSDEASALVPAPESGGGVEGPPGEDGQTLYTWVKYADTPTTGMSDDPTGKAYLGLSYNNPSAVESTVYSDYAWSLIEGAPGEPGEDGLPGEPGADGQTTYTWVKYGDNASGGGMSDSPVGKTYIGLAYNKLTPTESTTPGDYQWALIQGPGRIYRTPEPPTGLTAADEATWFDTDNDNLQSYWDGNSWEPVPLGPGATTDDVIAGKKVPLDTRIELQWGVPDPSEAPDFLYESLKPIWSPGITTGSFHGLVVDGSSYVQMQSIVDNSTFIRSHRPMFLSTTDGSVTYGDFLPELNATYLDTGVTPNRTASLYPHILGMTKLGTTWYVLAQKQSVYPAPRAELFRYDANWNFISSTNVGISAEVGSGYHGLTNDGTNLITTFDADIFGAGSNPTKIEKRDPATWALVSSTTVTGTDLGTTGTYDPVDILPLANYDFGAPRYLILARVGSFFPSFKVVVVDSTGAQQATTFPVKQGYLGDEITSFRWNSAVSQYEFGGAYGGITRTTPLASDINVWTGYTLYDSVADPDTHESALSPVTSATTPVRKRHGLMVNGGIPTVDDDQAPDTIRVYARVGDATQPSPSAMDLQTATFISAAVNTNSVDNETVVGMFIDQPVNGGAAPPSVSSFPAAPSGEIVSELGGTVIRGDGTISSPFLTRLFDERYDGRYAPRSHTHEVYEASIANLGTRATAVEASAASLDTRLDVAEPKITAAEADIVALEAIAADITTTPTASSTASGSYTRTLKFARIGQLVFALGDIDRATGFNASFHDTGVRVPTGYRPVDNVLSDGRGNTSNNATYRWRFNTDGVVEIQQSAAIGQFMVATGLCWLTNDAMP